MKFKSYSVQLWFLDENPIESAKMLSNQLIAKNINGCIQALLSTYFYYFGIRSKKFYNFYFNKERKQDTMDRFFPCWPLVHKPSFQLYDTRQSKWTRKCAEHFDFVKKYLEASIDEYEFRFKKPHSAARFLEWIDCDAKPINIPKANVSKLTFEWKSVDPKFRSKDIIKSYRDKYKAMLDNFGIKITDFTNRDIPGFLLDEDKQKLSKWME